MERTGIILAGGISSRLNKDKGLLLFKGKPLVEQVLRKVDKVVDESFVVVSSVVQARDFARVLDPTTKIIVDESKACTPLVGAFTGLRAARGLYSLLLPCDTPFVGKEILAFLFDVCLTRNAAIPRWPNNYIEPLHAVYRTKPALEAAQNALNANEHRMCALVERLRSVRFVSTLVLQLMDSELKTFFNINTPSDLRRAEKLASDS